MANVAGYCVAGAFALLAALTALMGTNKDESTWSEKEGEDIDNDAG